jgi:curved DNA-binding protein CbpA
MKDYYTILELPVTATLPEIKKAYRKLAMQYHPDKKGDDMYAVSRFNDIKEAYEVLINPSLKENYLQERWLKKSSGVWMPDEPITPPLIVKQALELNRAIAQLDVHRMDAASVAQRILQLIPASVINKLKTFNEPDINATILTVLLQSTRVLPLSYTIKVAEQLRLLADDDQQQLHKIQLVLLQKEKREKWERTKVWMVLAAVVVICVLIYFGGR